MEKKKTFNGEACLNKKKKTLGILEFNRFITDSILSSWTSVADILLKKILAVVHCIVCLIVFFVLGYGNFSFQRWKLSQKQN